MCAFLQIKYSGISSVLLCLISLSAGAVIIDNTDTQALATDPGQSTRTFSVEALDIEYPPTAAEIIYTVDNSRVHLNTVMSIDGYADIAPSGPGDENAQVFTFGFESLRFQLPARSMTTPEPSLFALLVLGLIGLGFSYRD